MSTTAAVDQSSRSAGSAGKVRSTWPLYLLFFTIAGLVGGVISYSFLSESLVALGIPDPGIPTTFGLPFFRAVGWMLAALSIGSFLFSAFYISPRVPDNDNSQLNQATLSVDGHVAARTGAVAALCFAMVGGLQIPMILSDVSGTPLHQVLDPASLVIAVQQVATAAVWLISVIVALLVAIPGLFLRTWASQPVLLIGSVLMVVPLGMEGHAATGGDHDYGTNAYLWHLIFMAVWIGGLMALIAHARRLGPGLQTAVKRYSSVALFAFLAVAISGVVSTFIRIQPEHLFTHRYGLIIVAKMAGTSILGIFGYVHRELTIPKLDKDKQAFTRVAIVEVAVMAAVAGIAVTMGRTPPPAPDDPNLSSMEIQMGYELYVEPTFFSVWTVWRFDILFGTIGVLLAGFYLWALRRVKQQGKSWRTSYTVHWLLGCITLVVTMSSGMGLYVPASYSMHMVVHMVLSMIVPLFLALGAPLTLIQTAWDSGKPGEPNVHDWAHAFTEAKWLQVVTIPWVNLGQFMFFFYVLYLIIPLYELAIREHAGHLIMNVAFLVSGYFYFWELVGPDRIPNRRPVAIRLGWLVVSMPIHLFFGVYLMQLNTVMGEEFYRSLDLPWNPDLLMDQREGGGIAWAFGSFPLTYVMILMFLDWRAQDKKDEEESDRRMNEASRRRTAAATAPVEPAGADDGEGTEDEFVDELEAYNQMLARYNSAGADSVLSDYYGREFKDKGEK